MLLPGLRSTGGPELMLYYWTWYWPQSAQPAAADLNGSPTREEAIKAAQVEERRLRSIWGPGKGFRLEVKQC